MLLYLEMLYFWCVFIGTS